ncbi:hypothetical protein N8371_08760 [Vicingaceae bacterium]|nr:hypothetical protein [Vicingaceae bacterium]
MENLNKVEVALRKKCIKEISEIVGNFTDALKELELEYGNSVRSFYYITTDDGSFENDRKPKLIGTPPNFNTFLRESVTERFIDAMMKKKSEELLEKLELI